MLTTLLVGLRTLREVRGRRLDAAIVAPGGLASGGLALGTALLLQMSTGTEDAGPTAAALSDAYNLLLGAAIGLAVGSACVALAARTGSRILAGVVAGVVGYVLVLAPILIATAPSDFSISDSIAAVSLGALLLIPAIALGAAVGAGTAAYLRR